MDTIQGDYMDFRTFIGTYFQGWSIVGEVSCGISHGFLLLRSNEVIIKVHFKLNGDRHWTDSNVRADYVEADNDSQT